MKVGGIVMVQSYPILGESLELYQAAEDWAKRKEETIEKNENTRKQDAKAIMPMIEKLKKR